VEKTIGVAKAQTLLSLYNQANTIDSCMKVLDQQRMIVLQKLYDACGLLEIPVEGLKILLVEGKVEWADSNNGSDPKEEKAMKKE